ncbi:MAG TPA: hypothetical protein PKW80_14985 [Bacteroidales bacterium]|nr:hypothetical protein [Bacteroidales bacterium]
MELTTIEYNREFAKQRAEDESRRADMKQHADKLIQGFEKLEESHAKRAIWELFQNAIDLSDNCEIIIEITDEYISFKHNGKPFTSKTLSCLIKQVSSKNNQNSDDEVGQYGTGFICTHSFGKKILISGSLEEGNYFIPIENFEIDRIAANADPDLINKLIIQQKGVFELIENGELRTECSPYTTFSYQTNSLLEKQYAEKAVESLQVILPYVMMINQKLKRVKVYDKNGLETIYCKGDMETIEEISVTPIQINQTYKKIYSICSTEENLIIILPLINQNEAFVFNESLSKLFLFYPLIGSENFGFNYILHSKQFAPTEPRDGIHLKSKNEQVQEKESQNRDLLQKGSELIFDFVLKYSEKIENPHSLAYINFNASSQSPLLSEYFKELKKNWVNQFKTFQLVISKNGRIKPEKTLFLNSELLIDVEYFDAIYEITNLFWSNIPEKGVATLWTKYVLQWEDESTSFIRIADIVEKIQERITLDSFSEPENLLSFYHYLIKYGHGEIFNQFKLLPNIKNEFRLQSQLNSTLNIDNILIKVADVLIPDVPKRYIKPGFEFNIGFEPYDRKQFSKDINSQIAEYTKTIKENTLLNNDILLALIEYCKIFPSLENTGTRGQLIKLICEYYNVDSTFIHLPSVVNQEIDWLPSIKCLLRNFIWELNAKDQIWIESNKEFLKNVIFVIYNYYEFEELVLSLPIFPNQLFELCKQSELKLDGGIPEELKNLYDDIVKPQRLIRSTLVLNGFESYLKECETRYSKYLGDSIEKVFLDEKPYTEINDHPHKKDILYIIKKISDDEKWSKYFPTIEDKKAAIMMARISDSETKNDLFSIIGLDKNKIALLGELSRQEDLERIILLGKQALEEEKRNNADFQFKHTIGTHIEKIIREKIGADLINFQIKVRDEQGGQDIVIEFNSSIIYYIEVKSRWDIRNSITMSPLQMKNAVANKRIYSLCCVDLTDYKNGEADRYNVTDIQEIIHKIHVLTNIGLKIEPLLNGILAVKDYENEISLTGDYRGTIP